jgi:hypothetical protein
LLHRIVSRTETFWSNLRPRYAFSGLTIAYKLQVDPFVQARPHDHKNPPFGFNEQIFGADKQVPKGGCGPCPKNALWTRELSESDAGGGLLGWLRRRRRIA